MKKINTHHGFTLIELVVVIVILGILAAIAAPKFMDLQRDARIAYLRGVEGSIKSANQLLHAYAVLHGLDGLNLDPTEGENHFAKSAVRYQGHEIVRGNGTEADQSFFLNFGYVAVTWGLDRNSGLAQVIDKKAFNGTKKEPGVAGTVANFNYGLDDKCPAKEGLELCYFSKRDDKRWELAYLVLPGFTAKECSLEYKAASLGSDQRVIAPKIILHADGC